MKAIIYTVLLVTYALLASAFSGGSPKCNVDAKTLSNGKMGTQITGAKYKMTLSAKQYQPGKMYNVQLTKGTTYKGLLAFVADAKNNHVGSFPKLPKGMKYLTGDGCGGDQSTITHSDATEKDITEIQWQAPDQDAGPLKVGGAIVIGKAVGFQILADATTYAAAKGGNGGGGGGGANNTDPATPTDGSGTPTDGGDATPSGSGTPGASSANSLNSEQFISIKIIGAIIISTLIALVMH